MAKDNNIDGFPSIQRNYGPKTTHVKHDSAHCLAPGLFRSLKKGDRKIQKLHVTYMFGKKELMEFKGFEPLGAEDLVVFQGLVAMAGMQKLVLRKDPQTEHGKVLRERLKLEWDAVPATTLVIISSFRKLAREIGFDPDSGSDIKTIRNSIERLSAVSIFVQAGEERHGFHMLSCYRANLRTGQLRVALNPRIAAAIFGGRPYSRINMDEVRSLKGGPARILHQRLSAMISPGTTKKILPATLISYIWPDEATGSTLRKRRTYLKKALAEIAAIGAWQIKEGYEISRKGDFKKALSKHKKRKE